VINTSVAEMILRDSCFHMRSKQLLWLSCVAVLLIIFRGELFAGRL
jgi:hypothetical protein